MFMIYTIAEIKRRVFPVIEKYGMFHPAKGKIGRFSAGSPQCESRKEAPERRPHPPGGIPGRPHSSG